MARLVYDFETNGLFADSIRPGTKNFTVITRVHCLVTRDLDTGEVQRYVDPYTAREAGVTGAQDTIANGVRVLLAADLRAGHNVCGYDERVLREFFPDQWAARNPAARVCDTMVGANVVFPDEHLAHLDYARLKVPGCTFPKNLVGRFSLEAWGHRMGVHKGGYEGDFQTFTPAMLAYCVQDVAVTAELFRRLEARIKGGVFSWRAWQLEQDFKAVIDRQQAYGFAFDRKAAEALEYRLAAERAELHDQLVAQFPPKEVVTVSPVRKKRNVKSVPFNPNSDMQVAERLQGLGWRPTVWTAGSKRKDGKGLKPRPKLTDDVLEHLDLPGADLLLKYAQITKRLEQLSTGDAAWLKHVREDGRIHGRVKHNGAVTSRCTHSSPPIVGVPKVGKYLGKECRGLFHAPDGKLLVGVDASGGEIRCQAHYLHPLDGGKYVEVVTRGDIHTFNQKAFGIPDGPLARDTAKRGLYALLYGAGDRKLAATIGTTPALAKLAKQRFYRETKVGALSRDVAAQVRRTGTLGLPDGRHAWVRSPHSALNTLLQGTLAIVMKVAVVRMHRRFRELGLEVEQVHQAHDEVQLEVWARDAEVVAREAAASVVWAGERLGIRCPMEGKATIGKTWAETH